MWTWLASSQNQDLYLSRCYKSEFSAKSNSLLCDIVYRVSILNPDELQTGVDINGQISFSELPIKDDLDMLSTYQVCAYQVEDRSNDSVCLMQIISINPVKSCRV